MRGTRKQVSIILLMAATMLVAAAAVSASQRIPRHPSWMDVERRLIAVPFLRHLVVKERDPPL